MDGDSTCLHAARISLPIIGPAILPIPMDIKKSEFDRPRLESGTFCTNDIPLIHTSAAETPLARAAIPIVKLIPNCLPGRYINHIMTAALTNRPNAHTRRSPIRLTSIPARTGMNNHDIIP